MASIRKRNNKYQVQVRRAGNTAITRSFHKLSDAREWARLIETQADRQELMPSRKALEQITLGQLVTRYRDEVISRKKGAEIGFVILNAFLRHPICRKTIKQLTTADFAMYRDERLKTIKAKSLKRQLSPIQNMFEVARDEWGLPIKENPLSKLKLKATDNSRERRLREGELERLIEAGKKLRNPYVLAIALFATQTAMRRGEMLALRWTQVDVQRRSVTILESKNGYSRIIPLTNVAMQIVKQLWNFQKGMSNGIIDNHNSYTLLTKRDKKITHENVTQPSTSESQYLFPISANSLRLSWERLCNRVKIEDLHFHDLRHEAVSRFFEMGLTVPEVASISGHRDMRMLLRYAHANPDQLINKLSQTQTYLASPPTLPSHLSNTPDLE